MNQSQTRTESAVIPDIADPAGPPLLLNQLWKRLLESKTPFTFFAPTRQHTCTFADLGAEAAVIAGWLREELELPKGARIGIKAANSREWVVLDLACVLGGYTVFPIEAHLEIDPAEAAAAYQLSAFFTDRETEDAQGCRQMSEITARAKDAGLDIGVVDFVPAQWSRDDIISAKFTSGTMSKPKVVAAKAINVENSICNVQRLMHHTPGDLILVFLPLSLLQQRMWIYSAIMFDIPVAVTTPLFSVAALADLRPTVVMGVPDFYDNLRRAFHAKCDLDLFLQQDCARFLEGDDGDPAAARVSPLSQYLGGRIRYLWTGSAPASEATLDFFDLYRVPLLQGYGMNEACIVAKNGPSDNRKGSSGKVLPNYCVTFDANRQIVIHPACEVNNAYLDGSFGDPRTFGPGGEVYSGDIGYLDDDGYLYVTGRIKEMIPLSNGRNIDPKPIEYRLTQHESVSGAVVIGAGRPFCLGLITIDPKAARPPDLNALRTQVNADLPQNEGIGKLVCLSDQFTIENGLLTSQYKLRRPAIEARYKEIIGRAYGDSE